MARGKNGSKFTTGKINDKVGYLLNGQWVERGIGKWKNPPTDKQKPNLEITGIINNLLKPVMPYIRIGFREFVRNTTWHQHNAACSINRSNAINTESPNLEVDFTKAVFSQGDMPIVDEVNVNVVEEGIEFSWNPDYIVEGMQLSDQAMLLAYCPEKEYAFYQLYGERRIAGKDVLKMQRYSTQVTIHTYLTFISADGKSITTSIYTGEYLW